MAFEKVKSHLTPEEIANRVYPLDDVIVNQAADTLADKAAAAADLPPALVKNHGRADARSWVVQKRIIAAHQIACSAPRHVQPKTRGPGRAPAPTVHERLCDLRALGHDVHQFVTVRSFAVLSA